MGDLDSGGGMWMYVFVYVYVCAIRRAGARLHGRGAAGAGEAPFSWCGAPFPWRGAPLIGMPKSVIFG